MRLLFSRPAVSLLCLLFSFVLTPACPAQTAQARDSFTLESALRQLIDRFATAPNLHGPFKLQFFQDPAFAAETGKDWQDFFRQQLESHHFSVSDSPDAALLRVGVAETPAELVLSATTRIGEKDEVRLLTFPRASFRAPSLPVVPVRLEKQLVFQTSDRLLDASSPGNDTSGGMAVLAYRDFAFVALRIDSVGAVQQSVSLTAAGPLLSRDPRVELSLEPDAPSIVFSEKSCPFSWTAANADIPCRAAKSVPRAPAVLTPSCDSRAWKLLADSSDWSTPDLLEAVPNEPSHKGSAAILSDFPGPIIAISAEQNPSASALVVTRNLRTGNYEVYKVTLACGN
ncbi:MAG TPA: hypothetical protein VKB21_08290 [Candidatus Acidoferrum sp.]|nr:hypothetical protein [Candidatus Acidoferrum sp.]